MTIVKEIDMAYSQLQSSDCVEFIQSVAANQAENPALKKVFMENVGSFTKDTEDLIDSLKDKGVDMTEEENYAKHFQ